MRAPSSGEALQQRRCTSGSGSASSPRYSFILVDLLPLSIEYSLQWPVTTSDSRPRAPASSQNKLEKPTEVPRRCIRTLSALDTPPVCLEAPLPYANLKFWVIQL